MMAEEQTYFYLDGFRKALKEIIFLETFYLKINVQ